MHVNCNVFVARRETPSRFRHVVCHAVVLLEDPRGGAVLGPEVLLGVAREPAGVAEGAEDVLHVVAGNRVEVEVGGVEFGPEVGVFASGSMSSAVQDSLNAL